METNKTNEECVDDLLNRNEKNKYEFIHSHADAQRKKPNFIPLEK